MASPSSVAAAAGAAAAKSSVGKPTAVPITAPVNPATAGAAAAAASAPRPVAPTVNPAQAKLNSSGGGGFFGGLVKAIPGASDVVNAIQDVGHVGNVMMTGAAKDLYGIPGGFYKLGKDLLTPSGNASLGQQWAQFLNNPLSPFEKGNVNSYNQDAFASDVVGMGQASLKAISSPSYMEHHPDQTLLTLLPTLHVASATAANVADAADAARNGEGIAQVGKQLIARPRLQPRSLKVGNTEVPLQASRNAFVRSAQEIHDKAITNAIANKPESRLASYGRTRIGNSLSETRRYQETIKSAEADQLETSGRRLGGRVKMGEQGRTRQAALRLTAEQRTPDEEITYRQGQITKGVNPAGQQKIIDRMQAIKDQNLIGHDETRPAGQKVFINGEVDPKLAAVDEQLARAGGRIKEIISETGQLPAEIVKARESSPNVIANGGRYEKPTPAKLGVPSAKLLEKQGRAARLSRLYEKQSANVETEIGKQLAANPELTRIGNKLVGPGKAIKSTSPGDIATSEARLNELEKAEQKDLESMRQARFGPVSKQENSARNFENARARKQQNANGNTRGYTGRKSVLKPTIKQEQRNVIEREIHAAAEKNPEEPNLKAWMARSNEIDKLKKGLNPEFGEKPVAHISGPGRVITPHGGARLEKLGAALSEAHEEARRAGAAAARREKPTGIIGTPIREGRQHVTYASTEPKANATALGRTPQKVIGKVRALIPKTHKFTGENQAEAHVPDNTTGLVARNFRRQIRFYNTLQHRTETAEGLGSLTRKTSKDVLMNTQELKNAKVPHDIQALIGNRRANVDELAEAEGHEAAFHQFLQRILPGLDKKSEFANIEKTAKLGEEAPKGYTWVSREYLGDLYQRQPALVGEQRGLPSRSFDNFNAAQTAATVYFKPGHVFTRGMTNAVANMMQGSLHNLGSTFKMWRDMPEEYRLRWAGASGEPGLHALPAEGSNLVQRTARMGAHFWAKRVDMPFRLNSLLYEAKQHGFADTPEAFQNFLDQAADPGSHGMDAASVAKVDWVLKRANREAIAYDRLGNFEKNYIRRGVWFYPWVKGSVVFTKDVAVEHPFKALALGQIGAMGAKQSQKDLGLLPSYAQGNFKVGGSSSLPLIENANNVSPFGTPAQVLTSLANVNKPTAAEEFGSYLTPALGAGARAAFHLGSFGSASKASILGQLLQGFGETTPVAAAVQGATTSKAANVKKMYPTSTQYGLWKIALGSVTPRRMNVANAHKAYRNELKAAGIKPRIGP